MDLYRRVSRSYLIHCALVGAQDVNQICSVVINRVSDVVERWSRIKSIVNEAPAAVGKKSRPTSVIMSEPDHFEPEAPAKPIGNIQPEVIQ